MMGWVKITGVGCRPCLVPLPRDPGMLCCWENAAWSQPRQWGQGTHSPSIMGEAWGQGCLLLGQPRACRAGEWHSSVLYP